MNSCTLNLQNNARQLQIIEPLRSLRVAAMCGSQGVSLAVLWANLPNKGVQSMKTMAVELEAQDVTFTSAIKCSDIFFPLSHFDLLRLEIQSS